jgi:hypothetical protein
MNSDYSIPIIQGTPVAHPGGQQQYSKNSYEPTSNSFQNDPEVNFSNAGQFQQHQQQPNQFQDAIWAVAFVLHLAGMIFLISTNIAGGEGGGDVAAGSYTGLYALIAIAVAVSVGLSTAAIALMMRYPTEMVKAGLVFSVILMGVVALVLLLMGGLFGALIGIFIFAITAYYVKLVWSRIPFAAINLKTALSAVKSNMGLGVVAYLVMAAAFAWSGFWLAGMSGTLQASDGGITFLLLVSYFWTYKVLCNTVHVTTAGTVGTWWFVPGEAHGCWSTGLRDSFCRATTYSFGSICLGSLLVAVIQALEAMARQARQNEDGQILACLLECILSCIRDIVEYFNKWAYVYVGLYGFGYIEAGRNVIQLFKQKGWTVLITDDLNDRVLMMMSLGVGGLTGIVGILFAMADPSLLDNLGLDGSDSLVAFLISGVVGLVFSSILMSVVSSAVNTVIVCFAESPNEFEANHPGLSGEMRSAWMQA